MIRKSPERFLQYALVTSLVVETVGLIAMQTHVNRDLSLGFMGIGGVIGGLGLVNYYSTRNGGPTEPMF